jgi:hypothetical protein
MKRIYKKHAAFDRKRIGYAVFTLFVVFVAFKILTPPTRELVRIDSPDGSMTARLRMFHYTSEPSYKVDYREVDKVVWLNLLYLPSYTNAPHSPTQMGLEWSRNSERIYLKLDDTPIWQHAFEQ